LVPCSSRRQVREPRAAWFRGVRSTFACRQRYELVGQGDVGLEPFTKPVATSSHCGKRSRGLDIGGTLSGMGYKMTALERAFQLARSGQVSKIAEIVGSLKRDGYSTDQIQGPVLRRQLMDLIMAARREEMN
jgi:hypothetical protein